MHDIDSAARRRVRWFLPVAVIFCALNATVGIFGAEFIVYVADFLHTRLHQPTCFAFVDGDAHVMNVIAIDGFGAGDRRIYGTILVDGVVAVETSPATRWEFDRVACTSFVDTAPRTRLLFFSATINFTVRR